MKKTRLYFLVPILGLILFGGYYWNFRSQYEAHQQEIIQAAKAKKEEKLRQDELAREQAIKDAIDAQKQRKAERVAREALEQKQRDDQENAELDRDKAAQESQRLERQVDKLSKDVADAKKEIEALQTDNAKQVDEVAFLGEYVKKAEANRASLAVVLTKIQAADEAIAKAKSIADAQAKKSSE
jgi:colicin import membrane protein